MMAHDLSKKRRLFNIISASLVIIQLLLVRLDDSGLHVLNVNKQVEWSVVGPNESRYCLDKRVSGRVGRGP